MVGPREVVSLDGFDPAIVVLVERHAEDLETLVMVFPVEAHHVGVLHAAGAAPGGPEVDEHHFAAQVAELALLAVGVVHDDVGSLHAGQQHRAQAAIDMLHEFVVGPLRDQVVADGLKERHILLKLLVEEGGQEGTHEHVGMCHEQLLHLLGDAVGMLVEHEVADQIGVFLVEDHIVRALRRRDVQEVDGRHIVDLQGDVLARQQQHMNHRAVGLRQGQEDHRGVGHRTLNPHASLGVEGHGVDGDHTAATGFANDDLVVGKAVERAFHRAVLRSRSQRQQHRQ